jgi:putative spermidine/putrescine transport system ATP-binding protein
MTTIELNQVSRHYGPIRAVDRISLRVETGEYATILGPSGSGKTTMLSLIAGIAAPTAGSILIGGRDVTHLPAAARNVGLVFQSYALFPHMTVFDNVAFPMRVRRTKPAELRRRVEEALALVRLEAFGARKPHQLSGGQQQRVALARAVVFKPDILLLDEPLGALDRKLREEVRGEIHQLQRRLGITTIMVTHDQDEALSLSDRIVVLHGGRVQQIDTPINAYHRPNSRFVADFLGLANFLEGDLERSGGRAAIRLPSGEALPCAAPAEPRSGAVCGVLRPEDVQVANGDAGGLLGGRIAEAVFFGESVRYTIALRSGLRVLAHVPGSRSYFSEGAEVHLTWAPDRIWILPQEKGEA